MNLKVMGLAVGALMTSFAMAGTYSFQPATADLGDLDHYSYYTWGINSNIPQNEVITGAKLTITNIWDWTVEDNDILYVHLLDNVTPGVSIFQDNQGGGDNFAGQGMLIGTWTDPVGGHSTNTTVTFDLGQAGALNLLKQYSADGKFGFGFDPDCHYYNDGVKLTITTQAVPEPASMATLAIGGLALLRRRKKSAK